MSLDADKFVESVIFFHRGCGAPYLDEEELRRISQQIGLTSDLPLVFISLVWEFVTNDPLYFWSHAACDEVHRRLSELHTQDSTKLLSALDSAQEHIFAGINSYHIGISVERELSDVSYEESLKTKIFRNPLYVQLCEDCLMNLYRGLRCLVQAFRTDKDYSNLDTIGKILPALRSNGFPVVCGIDSDIRNAINHGNTLTQGTDILFKHKSNSGYTVRRLPVWEYQDLIDKTLDLASGCIVGVVRFLAEHPEMIEVLFSSADQDIRFQWFSLYFRAPNTRLLFTEQSLVGSSQLSITVDSSIRNRDRLLMALVQILRAAHVVFPDYERYLVGYQHNRSPSGFIRLGREILEKTNDTSELLQDAISAGEVLHFPIQANDVNERAFRFHVFPTVVGEGWVARGIEDCSIEGYKRIKARLLLEGLESRETIRGFLANAIERIRKLRTPENPREPVPYGDVEAEMVFLDVFFRSRERKIFTLSPSNTNFVCMAHYYAKDDSPRLKCGGIFESIWKQLEHEKDGRVSIAWNTNATT